MALLGSLGSFEQLILWSVVRLGDQAYGLAIRDSLEERTGRSLSSGTIYTALGRLEERRLVWSRAGESTPGRAGRPRKLYRVTPAGARAVMAAYSDLQSVAKGVVHALADLAEG
jgi:DNA-binding PadR family transcriptional regulator